MKLFSRAVSLGLTALLFAQHGLSRIIYAGVNSGMCSKEDFSRLGLTRICVAGGEFAQQNLPGAFGTDYRFINESSIDFFLSEGINTIRVTFLLVSSARLAYL